MDFILQLRVVQLDFLSRLALGLEILFQLQLAAALPAELEAVKAAQVEQAAAGLRSVVLVDQAAQS